MGFPPDGIDMNRASRTGAHYQNRDLPGTGGGPPAVGRRASWRSFLLAALGFAALVAQAPAADDFALEYKVKAGFLYNFAKFVEWPAPTMPTSNSPIVVGILADEPAAPVLQQALQNKMANGRPLTVKLLPDLSGLPTCHIFFLGRTQTERLEKMLAQAQGVPVLTVGEMEQFAQRGGLINFVRKDETFRFEINLEAAEKVGLRVSAKLANLATIVKIRK